MQDTLQRNRTNITAVLAYTLHAFHLLAHRMRPQEKYSCKLHIGMYWQHLGSHKRKKVLSSSESLLIVFNKLSIVCFLIDFLRFILLILTSSFTSTPKCKVHMISSFGLVQQLLSIPSPILFTNKFCIAAVSSTANNSCSPTISSTELAVPTEAKASYN